MAWPMRQLGFGPQDRYEKDLGYRVAAFEAVGYRPRDELVYGVHSAPGRQVGRFALHGDRTLFLFVFDGGAEAQAVGGRGAEGDPAQEVRRRWPGAARDPRSPRYLQPYFDRVGQIRLDAWSRGRIALVGDAGFCVSLPAGQGAALAITAAYLPAGELATSPDRPQEAYRRYEERLRPFITGKQRAVVRFAAAFVPRTRRGVFFRNQVIKAWRIPAVARLAIGRDIRDRMPLPRDPL